MYSVIPKQPACTSRCLIGGLVLALLSPFVAAQQILFDDFSYTNTTQFTNNGWRIRTWEGGPGLANGGWSTSNVSFVADPASPGNRLMRLKASTNVNRNNINTATNRANSGTTSQAEVSRVEQIYKNGTWAARMYFTDAPSTGPDGDTVIETFFGLTDYIEGREPYSEIDFEYLPNGGWWTGSATPAMWMTTYRIVDFSDPASRGHTTRTGSLQGWRTLVAHVMDGYIAFYIDGVYQASFSGAVAPDHPMYLMFQIWFSNDCFDPACNVRGYLNSSSYREYYEDIDWVYFEKDNIVTPAVVNQKVASLRAAGTTYVQTLTGGGTSSTSSVPASSSSSSSSTPAAQQCNWWGTYYAICTHITSGWGWQNNADCIGIQTCATLSPPYGVVGGNVASSSSATSVVSSSSSSAAPSFTRLIQAEAYTHMAGVQTEATTDVDGGLNVGWIDTGDWMSYANITFPAAGSYRVDFRVASPTGSQLSLDLNGGATQLGTVTIPATGGWQSWTTVSRTVQLPAGTHSVGLYAPQGGWNINWLRITRL